MKCTMWGPWVSLWTRREIKKSLHCFKRYYPVMDNRRRGGGEGRRGWGVRGEGCGRIAHFYLPTLVLTPLRKAVAVPAESATCWSTLYVLERADHGKCSQLRTYSSPVWFSFWPARMRAAVTVVTLIPSPRKKIVFFAVWVIGFLSKLSLMSSTPSLNQWFFSWLGGRGMDGPTDVQKI